MQIEQISVFMENKAGRLARVTDVLSEAGIHIKAMIVTDTTDFGVLRMIVDDPQKTVRALKNRGFASNITSVSAVELENTPHEIHNILVLLDNAGINVEYMYAYTQQEQNTTMMIFMSDDTEKTARVLENL